MPALESHIKAGSVWDTWARRRKREEFLHFDTALITTDAFRIRPNSICLSLACLVWDPTLLLHSRTAHCRYDDGRTDAKGHLPMLPRNIRRNKEGGESHSANQRQCFQSFWSGLSSKHLRLFRLSSVMFDISPSADKCGCSPLKPRFNYGKAAGADWSRCC